MVTFYKGEIRTQTEGRRWETSEEDGHLQAKERSLRKKKKTQTKKLTLISDFKTPDCGKVKSVG